MQDFLCQNTEATNSAITDMISLLSEPMAILSDNLYFLCCYGSHFLEAGCLTRFFLGVNSALFFAPSTQYFVQRYQI